MHTPWDHRYAHRTQRMGSSAIIELLKLTERPDIISFGGGLPAPEVFPVEEFAAACVNRHDATGMAVRSARNTGRCFGATAR